MYMNIWEMSSMQCICFAKFPPTFRINGISWGFCSTPFVFAVWPRWCLMIRPSWRHPWRSRRFRKTRGGAFDLCRCGCISELGEPSATQFHKVSHRQNIFGRLAGSFKKVNMCACVFFIVFFVFCWKIFVARMFLADSYVLVGGVFLQSPYQKMSVVIILQVPSIYQKSTAGCWYFNVWATKTKNKRLCFWLFGFVLAEFYQQQPPIPSQRLWVDLGVLHVTHEQCLASDMVKGIV